METNKKTTALQELNKLIIKAEQPGYKKPIGSYIDAELLYCVIERLRVFEAQTIMDAYNQGYREGETEIPIADGKDVSQFSNAQFYFSQTFESGI